MIDLHNFKRARSQDSDDAAASVNLLQSSPEQATDEDEDEGDDEQGSQSQQPSPTTRTLEMLSSQQLSQDDLMYDHSQRHVDATRVQQEQNSLSNSQNEHRTFISTTDAVEAQPMTMGRSMQHIEAAENKQASHRASREIIVTKQCSPGKRSTEGKETDADAAIDSDDETVDPDELVAANLPISRWTSPRKTSAILTFENEKEANLLLQDESKQLEKDFSNHHRSRRVAQMDPATKQIIAKFPSFAKAAEQVEKNPSQISSYRSAIGRVAAAGIGVCRKGFAWKYVDGDEDLSSRPVPVPNPPTITSTQCITKQAPVNQRNDQQKTGYSWKQVAHVDENGNIIEVFSSYAQAAKAHELKTARQNAYAVSIGRAATGKRVTCCKGMSWKLIVDKMIHQPYVNAPEQSPSDVDRLVATTSQLTTPSDFSLVSMALSTKSDRQSRSETTGRAIAQLDTSGAILDTFASCANAARALEPIVAMRTRYRKEIGEVLAQKKQKCRKGYGWQRCDNHSTTSNIPYRTTAVRCVMNAPRKKSQKLSRSKGVAKHVSFAACAKLRQSSATASQAVTPPCRTPSKTPSLSTADAPRGYKYSLNTVTITMEGSLDMLVTQYDSPMDLKEIINTEQLICCKAHQINQSGIGAKSGFCEEDVLLQKVGDTLRFWEYESFRKVARHWPRPLQVLVARKLNKADVESASALLALQVHLPLIKPTSLNPNILSPNKSRAIGQMPMAQAVDCCTNVGMDNGVVPFCKLCNGGHFREHHAWCPEHPHFHHNNAEKILNRIRRGIMLKCATCAEEYTTGKIVPSTIHSEICRSDQAKTNRAEKATGGSKRKLESNKETELLSVGTGAKALEQMKKRKPLVMSITKRTNHDSSTNQLKPTIHNPSCAVVGVVQPNGHVLTPQLPQQQRQMSYWDMNSTLDTKLATIDWVSSNADFWGFEGYKEDDVLVWSICGGIGHLETLLPSERFVVDPFASSRGYKHSHTTPGEGFHNLLLRRDPFGKLPWGFDWERHTLGGACLVTRVDTCTPASVATFLGDPSRSDASKLRGNDMLLAINGLAIGGMTSEDLQCELELSGQNLQLVVSRSKQSLHEESCNLLAQEALNTAFDEASSKIQSDNAFARQTSPLRLQSHRLLDIYQEDTELNSETHQSIALQTGAVDDTPCVIVQTDKTGASAFTTTSTRDAINSGPISEDGSPFQTKAKDVDGSEGSIIEDEASHESQYVSNGCICGVTHTRLEVFWIRCDGCDSWYCIAERCAGMTKAEAEALQTWLCLACDECPPNGAEPGQKARPISAAAVAFDVAAVGLDALGINASESNEIVSALNAFDGAICQSDQADHVVGLKSWAQSDDFDQNCEANLHSEVEVFPKDLVVYITQHAWVGVDNPAGIAKVLASRIDEDGDRVYDIRYVVGGSRKNVLAKYVSRHSWTHPAGW
ncbi:hypothetical protein MPSEU_000365800 [Mayamaea pseudoterrestris]|nr:hypothetical protein MPSEU_000365800 [Mayamaea pseudoterrestris]